MLIDGKPHLFGVIRDITEQKKAEEDLRTSRLQLAEAADMARIAYWEMDGRKGEFLFNDGFYHLYGTTAAREGGYRMSTEEYGRKFVHPDDRAELRRQIAENRQTRPRRGELDQYEHRGLRRDGKVIHILTHHRVVVDRKGHIRKAVGVSQDITERKKAEDELKLLKHSIDVHYDGAYWLDSDNKFVYVNDAACKSLGCKCEDLIGRTVFDVWPHQAPERMKEIWERLRKEGSYLGESVQRRIDGTEFPVELVATYVRFGGGEFVCAFARDITDKRKLEAQLRQAQKMEAIGTLAGGVAHDFNNILTVITGLGSVVQMSASLDEHTRQYIDQILLASQRAADLTQSLLAFSRKQSIMVSPHSVNSLIATTAKLLRRLLPEDIELKLHPGDQAGVTLLDVSQFDQVLMNLATNARDAMPHGGSFTIKTGNVELDETFQETHGFGKSGRYVHLSISDTGIGMDDKTMARIFDPFFTTKEIGKGTGLGLASVYGIVKQHGGYITVTSSLGEGTTFDIYFPPVEGDEPQSVVSTAQPKGGSETVLVVEDDPGVRNVITGILRKEGYVVLEAGDGDDAIRVFGEHRETIKLVILDVVMPGKNGSAVFDEIARIEPKIKAIFMSGYTGDVVIDKGIQKEDVEFLQKPLSVAKLLAKVREVLDR
jgi:two-component system cell cycle sensor histidine kinase/response regulator CckA